MTTSHDLVSLISRQMEAGSYDSAQCKVLRELSALLQTDSRQDALKPVDSGQAEQILDSIPVGLLTLDAGFRICYANRRICELLGMEKQACGAGAPFSALLPDSELLALLRQASISGMARQTLPVTVPQASDRRYLEFTISPILSGTIGCLLLMAQDVTERVRSQEQLRRFRTALDNSINAVYLIDRDRMRFIDLNATALHTLGYRREELLKLGPQDLRTEPGETEKIRRCFDEILAGESKSGIITTEHRRKDGTCFPVEIYLRAMQSAGSDILVAEVRDITGRLRAEAVLRNSEEHFRVAFNQAAVGLAHVALGGRWTMVNNKLCEIVGFSRDELLTMRACDITHPDDVAADFAAARRMVAGELDEQTREKRYLHSSGHYIWVNLTNSIVRDVNGNPKYFSTVIEDISRRKQVEEELLRLANHDALTGLPNRSLLLDRLSQAQAYAKRSGRQVAVLLIDLDRFKNINDSLGHEAGDKIILEIAHRLSSCTHDNDTVARLGGDEFVVIRPDVAREGAVAVLARQVLDVLAQPLTVLGHEVYPSGSIGISIYPRDGDNGATLLKNADTAMYRAKQAGRNDFQFYAHEMNARALDRLKLESALRRALERQELVLHYQPQMDIGSGIIVGVEALLRWTPQGREMLLPVDFISLAEESGLVLQIGEWVLRTACMQRSAWMAREEFAHLKIAVNLSARQFKQQDVVDMVSRALRDSGCPPCGLCLEITESAIMDDPESAAATLRQLSAMGVHLAIDDFGTGYSSLSYLKRFPIDALKIDKSFVRDITTDSEDAAIAQAVILLAHSLKLCVIAEGVETREQLDFLRVRQCDQMQGYYLSRPLALEELEQLLLAHSPLSKAG